MKRFWIQLQRIPLLAAVSLASLCLTGGNLFLLQTAAWGWMIASYSSEDTLSTAISDTFSGERPCSLCKAIADTKSQPEQAASVVDTEKLKLLSERLQTIALVPPSPGTAGIPPDFPTVDIQETDPETPPPRGGLQG